MIGRLSRNTMILLTSNGLTAILAFFLTALIGRGLGDAGLGRYAAIMAWILPFTLLADAGINTLMTRDVAQDKALTLPYLQAAIRWRWLIGGGLVMLIILIAPLLSDDRQVVAGLRIAALLVLIDASFGVYTALWRAWETMLPIMVLNIALLLMQVIGAGLAIWLDAGLYGVLAALVIADGIQFITTWLLWRSVYRNKFELQTPPASTAQAFFFPLRPGGSNPHLQPGYSDNNQHGLLRRAAPFAVAGILAAVQLRLVFILLEHLTSASVLGWFAAANRFIEAAKMPPFALFGALFPVIASLRHDPDRLQNLMRKIMIGLVVYGAAVAIGLMLFGGWLINLVFGAAFDHAIPLLQLMGWALIPILLRQQITLRYYADHAEQRVNRILMAALPLQALTGYWLIDRYGAAGGIWTIILTEIGLLLALWIGQFRR